MKERVAELEQNLQGRDDYIKKMYQNNDRSKMASQVQEEAEGLAEERSSNNPPHQLAETPRSHYQTSSEHFAQAEKLNASQATIIVELTKGFEKRSLSSRQHVIGAEKAEVQVQLRAIENESREVKETLNDRFIDKELKTKLYARLLGVKRSSS